MYLCLSGREFVSNAGDKGDVGVTPGSGRSPDEGNGSPLQYSCWENSMDRELGRIYSPRGGKELHKTE